MVFSLPLAGLPKEHRLLSSGQYWLFGNEQHDADRFCAGILAGLPVQSSATLICGQKKLGKLQKMLSELPAASVAVHTHADRFTGGACRFAQQHLTNPEGLRKVFKTHPAVEICLLRISLAGCGLELAQWAAHERLNRWLKAQNKVLLIVADGFAKADIPLNSLAGMVQGCMFLERADGMLDLSVFLWSNQLGLYADLNYRMGWDGNTLQHEADPEQVIAFSAAPALDQQQLVFQRQSLQGLSLLSSHWSVLDSYEEMLDRARSARAATLVFALDSNAKARKMANDFMNLRMGGGNDLKLVVREIEPCLRYVDQKLLLLSGASFIIPDSTANQHMLLFLSALKGLQWNRPLAARDSLASNLEPQSIRGVVTTEIFREAVRSVLKSSMGEVVHQLLELELHQNIAPDTLESQLLLRRYGDIATFAGNKFYLFLFACPDTALTAALHNIFKLPVSVLFSQARKITDADRFIRGLEAGEDILPRLEEPKQQERVSLMNGLQPVLLPAVGKGKQSSC